MTDRGLLELAAKALGATFFASDGECPDGMILNGAWLQWNPLTDDGDALRLAVKLRMEVHCEDNYVTVWHQGADFDEGYGLDKQQAVRCAIVRAAAEIGSTK